MTEPEPLDAEEAPPSAEPRETTVFPYGREPLLWVRTGGAWRWAIVRAKHTYADGRVAVQTEVTMPTPDGPDGNFVRTYWWNPDRMRVIRGPVAT